jgi:hypothetical protein
MVTEEGELKVDFEDDIIAAAGITEGGAIRNERAAGEGGGMTLFTEITILVLAIFVGFEGDLQVPTTLQRR